MTAIKICGIKTEEQALAAAAAGADYIGLVFATSPRQITPVAAKKIMSALKHNRARAEAVGVFVNTPVPTMRKIADDCRLDWVQLSGDEPWVSCVEVGLPVVKVIRVSRTQRPEAVIANLEYGQQVLAGQKHMFLLDANAREKYGGAGLTFDWKLAVPVAEKFPVIIAGGLKPENVGKAIKLIKPWGVDVSTGVETKGVKDMKKITGFIEAVRQADASRT
ncbi:MAG: phosphoribosylanthranilate isomerase [Dehalococcoidales bacterium]|jgi:phosphoribosylanthranilate isomerase